jgi:hypothetical protein
MWPACSRGQRSVGIAQAAVAAPHSLKERSRSIRWFAGLLRVVMDISHLVVPKLARHNEAARGDAYEGRWHSRRFV